MERHPVPQNIMDVEFKLFGALTVKQFGYAAGGFVVALIAYFTPLPDILRWFFVGFSIFAGLFLALFKINGQPSTVWVSNFLISMIEPQERRWKKTPIIPDILKDNKQQPQTRTLSEAERILSKNKVDDLVQRPLDNVVLSKEEQELTDMEDEQLGKIDKHFEFIFNDLPQVPKASTSTIVQDKNEKLESPIVEKPTTLASGVELQNSVQDTVYQNENYAVKFTPMNNRVNRPISKDVVLNHNLEAKNYVKGEVVDSAGLPINDAYVYILNLKNDIIRSSKTYNKGEFNITTPLEKGNYYIDIKKEGYKFPRYTIALKGDKVFQIKLQSLK